MAHSLKKPEKEQMEGRLYILITNELNAPAISGTVETAAKMAYKRR